MIDQQYCTGRPLSSQGEEILFEGKPIKSYLDKYPTPFYLYSKGNIESIFNSFAEGLKSRGVTDALICYALKANPRHEVVSTLAACGAGADIVSGGELEVALKAGVSPEKIVFSGVGKTARELERAIEVGVYSLNIESLEEWIEASEIATKHERPTRASLRFNPMVESNTHKHISTGASYHKFGMSREDILEVARRGDEMIRLSGISIHIGSQLMDMKGTTEAIIRTCALIKELEAIVGREFEFFDVGGGLAVDYEPGIEVPQLDEYLDIVVREIKKGLGRLPRLIFEPGRYLVARSGILITQVLRRKITGGNHFLIVDAGMNDFARSSLYGAYHHILDISKSTESRAPTHVVGPICETTDSFASSRSLNGAIAKGDYLIICDTGAYGESMANTYNCRELVKGHFA